MGELRGSGDGADEPSDDAGARGPDQAGGGRGNDAGARGPGQAGSGPDDNARGAGEAGQGADHNTGGRTPDKAGGGPEAAGERRDDLDGGLGRYRADVLARVAFQDRMPPRQEAWAAAARGAEKDRVARYGRGDGACADEGRRSPGAGEGPAPERAGEAPPTGTADSPAAQAARPDDAPADPRELMAAIEAVRDMKAQYEAGLRDMRDLKATYEAGLRDAREQGARHEADLNELKAGYEAKLEERGAQYEALITEVKTGYEARMNESEARTEKLEADLQALKDGLQAVPDAPGGVGEQAEQSRADNRELVEGQRDAERAEHQDDKPGPWSNAKYQLYGAVGGTMTSALISEVILDSPAGALIAIISAVPPVIGAFVPVLREGWRKRDSSAKP